jgi:hypothetical protein
MKSKNPQAFWWRWMGISALHAIAFTSFWMSNRWVLVSWYGFPLLHFVSAMILAGLQFWAMSLTMRPNAKRWFSVSILAYGIAVILYTFFLQSLVINLNYISLLWPSLFLIPALAHSWELSEHFKKAWVFALAAFLPAYILFAQLPYPEIYQNYALFEIVVQVSRSLIMGGSLAYLQKYQRKETESIAVSHERLELKDAEGESIPNEYLAKAQQKQS